MNPFRKRRNLAGHQNVMGNKYGRRNSFMRAKSVRLRTGVGIIKIKKSIECALLTVDGFSEESLVDVQNTLAIKKPDFCFILETKRRFEEKGSDIPVDG